jgi:hypothetical protein
MKYYNCYRNGDSNRPNHRSELLRHRHVATQLSAALHTSQVNIIYILTPHSSPKLSVCPPQRSASHHVQSAAGELHRGDSPSSALQPAHHDQLAFQYYTILVSCLITLHRTPRLVLTQLSERGPHSNGVSTLLSP